MGSVSEDAKKVLDGAAALLHDETAWSPNGWGSAIRSTDDGCRCLLVALVHARPCLVCRATPCREAAHVRMSSQAGMGRKPSDLSCAPLCHRHHMEQHAEGEKAWWDRHGIDPRIVIDKLNQAYPDLEQMRGIALQYACTRVGQRAR